MSFISLPRLGRTVVIRDAAFVTCVDTSRTIFLSLTFNRFHAVLAYLYTSEIEFGSLNRIDAPFAKSIYRLADKVLC